MVRKITNAESVVFAGDIHGEFRTFGYILKQNKIRDSLIIVAGDFGMGFHKPGYYDIELGRLGKTLGKYGNTLVVIRGNHDDPSYFTGGREYLNIQLAADYDVIEVGKNRILLIGGARSVDKLEPVLPELPDKLPTDDRVEGFDWWPGEKLVLDEEKLIAAGDVDCVCTHTAPMFCSPPYINERVKLYAVRDKALLHDLKEERDNLTRVSSVINKSRLKSWYYGHYHLSNTEYIDGVKYRALDRLYVRGKAYNYQELVMANELNFI